MGKKIRNNGKKVSGEKSFSRKENKKKQRIEHNEGLSNLPKTKQKNRKVKHPSAAAGPKQRKLDRLAQNMLSKEKGGQQVIDQQENGDADSSKDENDDEFWKTGS
jgi:hypothetical protein